MQGPFSVSYRTPLFRFPRPGSTELWSSLFSQGGQIDSSSLFSQGGQIDSSSLFSQGRQIGGSSSSSSLGCSSSTVSSGRFLDAIDLYTFH